MAYVASSDTPTLKSGTHRVGGQRQSRSRHVQLALVASDGVRGVASISSRRDQDLLQFDASSTFLPLPATAVEPKRFGHWLRHSAILFSICLHGAVAVALFDWSANDDQFGTLADKTEAISLATEQTLVLESIETETVQTAAAASAASQAGSVQSVAAVAQPMTETAEPVEATEPPPQPIEIAEAKPSAAVPTEDPLSVIRGAAAPDEVSETKAIQPDVVDEVKPTAVEVKEVADEQEKKEDLERKERKLTAQAASQASMAGSTTSRASAAQAAVSGRVSASRGTVLNYAARVRTMLARNKPSGDGHRGTARISFGLTSTGDLSYVRVATSSGRTNLDQAAIRAVRQSAPFGQPPANVSVSDLKFTIPFYFR